MVTPHRTADKRLVAPTPIMEPVIVVLAGLVAAIFWNLLTWWFGIPSSSSHTLIGGFAGAAIAYGGFGAVNSDPIIRTAVFIILAPLVGMFIAFVISLWFLLSFRKDFLPRLVSIAIKLKTAAHNTAWKGVSTFVETTVAIELAAS